MASPNLSGASATGSVGSAATEATNIKAPPWDHVTILETGETRMWDVGGDSFDSLGGIGILEVADLSLDEPELQAVTFGVDAQEVDVVEDNETNEE